MFLLKKFPIFSKFLSISHHRSHPVLSINRVFMKILSLKLIFLNKFQLLQIYFILQKLKIIIFTDKSFEMFINLCKNLPILQSLFLPPLEKYENFRKKLIFRHHMRIHPKQLQRHQLIMVNQLFLSVRIQHLKFTLKVQPTHQTSLYHPDTLLQSQLTISRQ